MVADVLPKQSGDSTAKVILPMLVDAVNLAVKCCCVRSAVAIPVMTPLAWMVTCPSSSP